MKQTSQLMYEGLVCLSLRDPEAILPMHCLIIGGFQQLSEACGVQVSPLKDWIGHMIECGKVNVGVAFMDGVFCRGH